MDTDDFRPLWQAGATALERGVCARHLAPAWAMLLFGDGSPTRHLGIATGSPVGVEVLSMAPHDGADAPAAVGEIEAPRLRREVWLTHPDGRRLAHAVSWWPGADADRHLGDRAQPIWASLAQRRVELYRELRGVALGRSAALEAAFGTAGPLWRRHYVFWRAGRPLTLIVETFSPALDRWLGASQAVETPPDHCPDCARRR
jgi:chorismate lyase